MTAPERQSAASAVQAWSQQRGWAEEGFRYTSVELDSLVALLESREVGLLAQVAAIRAGVECTAKCRLEDGSGCWCSLATDPRRDEHEIECFTLRNICRLTAEAAREHDRRVREEEREACAKEADERAIHQRLNAREMGDGPDAGVYFGAWRCAEGIAAAIRARSQTEGA